GLDHRAVFVEFPSVPLPGTVVEVELEVDAGFRVAQFQFAGPGRSAIFVSPDLKKHELVAEVGEVLKSALAAAVVEKIGNDDHQPAMAVIADKFADDGEIIGGAAGLERGEAVHDSRKAVASARGEDARLEAAVKAVDLDGVEPDETDVAECGGEF